MYKSEYSFLKIHFTDDDYTVIPFDFVDSISIGNVNSGISMVNNEVTHYDIADVVSIIFKKKIKESVYISYGDPKDNLYERILKNDDIDYIQLLDEDRNMVYNIDVPWEDKYSVENAWSSAVVLSSGKLAFIAVRRKSDGKNE